MCSMCLAWAPEKAASYDNLMVVEVLCATIATRRTFPISKKYIRVRNPERDRYEVDQIKALFNNPNDLNAEHGVSLESARNDERFGSHALRHWSFLHPLSPADRQLLAELKTGCEQRDWVWRIFDREYPVPRPAVDGHGKPRPPATGARDFLFAPQSQAWRIECWHLLKTTMASASWTETAERLEQAIFGLSDRQIENQQRRQWETSAGFGCATNYAVVERCYLAELEALNRRAFPTPIPAGATCFRLPDRQAVDRAMISAKELLAPDAASALIRFGTFWKVEFPARHCAGMDILALSDIPVSALNRALKTSIHLFTADGWIGPRVPD